MLRPLPARMLTIALLLSTTGCGSTKTIRVPYPVRVVPPPCVSRKPPTPPPNTTPADIAWADYYTLLVEWSWATWEACKPPKEATP